MRFQTELIPATLIRRYKRFLADVRLKDGREAVAHCPNPGSMMGLKDIGAQVWLEPNDDPRKKLKFGWRLVESGGLVCIDTGVANRVVSAALKANLIPELTGYDSIKPEQKYGQNSRIDFLLDGPQCCYVEVKSVTLMRQDGRAEFPDSVTARGAKHLGELTQMVALGHRAVQLFLVARTDCHEMGVAWDLDPTYGAALARASDAGVEVICYDTDISAQGVALRHRLPIDISNPSS